MGEEYLSPRAIYHNMLLMRIL